MTRTLQNDSSIEDQVRICKARAEAEGWEVVQVYTDHGISGASMLLRPGIQALMHHSQMSMFDIVMTEGLDRLSRDQEDVAGIYKRIKFAGAEIYSLSDGGIVSEIHIGLKGTMNALFLKDLAIKTHRGLSGRVEKGKSGGGICYGYKVLKQLSANGELERGEREIIPEEANIVRQIFKDYAAGVSPKKIALKLNSDNIPCPSGKAWGASTIYGNRRRGTGIINNELYIGRLVWNRQKFIKDPDTGKRVSRLNPSDEWQVTEVPHLRIIEQALWLKVKDRQKALDEKPNLQSKRRPPNLLSYLLKCGCCGGGISMVSAERYGCSTSRNKGTCANRLTIRKDALENTILNGLQKHLMKSELIDAFCEEYTKHINTLRKARYSKIDRYKKELVKLAKDKENIIEAIKNGIPASEIKDSLMAIANRRDSIEAYLKEQDEPQVLLHPSMAKRYQQEIKSLRVSLNKEESRTEAAELLRGLIDRIVLTPKACGKEYTVDLHGDLAGILSIATGREKKITEYDPLLEQISSVSEQLECVDFLNESTFKGKMVAGAGFEPTTFGL
ncbi:recombinase family protein [Thalassotalea euphylliae]|uniref:recombinase family protein n=1 Tax=Thalassotalea euphylliae TaxID=1655234 RepID=UPI0035ABEC9E